MIKLYIGRGNKVETKRFAICASDSKNEVVFAFR